MKTKRLIAILSAAVAATALAACSAEEEEGSDHEHEYPQTYEHSETQHWKECECGQKSELATHDGSWTVVVTGSHEVDGKEQRICSTCGYVMDERITPMADAHTYNVSQAAPEYFASVAQNGGIVYYLSCSCGVSSGDPTKTFTVPHTEHTYNILKKDAEAGKHWNECICGRKDADTEVSCATTITAWAVDADDETKHAGTCTCGNVVKLDHEVESWAVDVDDETKHAGTCSVCSSAVKAAHTFNKQVADNNYLHAPATTEHGRQYYYSCECGASEGDEDHLFVEGEPLADHTEHTYNILKKDADAGKHWYECICGQKDTTTEVSCATTITTWAADPDDETKHAGTCTCGNVVKLEHTVTDWAVDAEDDTKHTGTCSVCSLPSSHTQNGSWTVTTPATPISDGVETYTCEDCSYTDTRAVPATSEKGFGNNYYALNFDDSNVRATGADTTEGYVITISDSDGTDWHIKFARSFGTQKGHVYEVTYVFTSTVTGAVKIEAGDGAFTVSDGYIDNVSTTEANTATARFVAVGNAEGLTYTNLQLGMLPNGTVTIKSVTFKEINSSSSAVTTLANTNTDDDFDRTNVVCNGGTATATMVTPQTNNWDARVKLSTGVQIESGKRYLVTVKVDGLENDQNRPEVQLHKGGGFVEGEVASYAYIYPGDLNNGRYTRSFTADASYELYIWIEMGKMPAGSHIEISEIYVVELTGGESITLHTVPVAQALPPEQNEGD